MRKVSQPVIYSIILFISFSCGNFRKIEKSQDWRVKYEAGLNYYNKKDYYRASVLFDQILPIVRGLPEGEKVQFYLAYCQYYDKLYLLASEQFKTFYETYGRSTLAEEARFMHAFSLFQASPNPNLDQTSSIEAMAAMQQFINRFPKSEFRDRGVEVILTTQQKLEEKGFENARQYYRMKMYNAAVVALNNFKQNYPDSKYIEEAYYLAILSEYKLAQQSVLSRQPERYRSVVDHYQEFLDRYPESSFLKEAEKLYAESLEKVNSLKLTKNS